MEPLSTLAARACCAPTSLGSPVNSLVSAHSIRGKMPQSLTTKSAAGEKVSVTAPRQHYRLQARHCLQVFPSGLKRTQSVAHHAYTRSNTNASCHLIISSEDMNLVFVTTGSVGIRTRTLTNHLPQHALTTEPPKLLRRCQNVDVLLSKLKRLLSTPTYRYFGVSRVIEASQ